MMTYTEYVGHTRGKSHYDSLMDNFHPTDKQLKELCDALEEARRWDEKLMAQGVEIEVIDFDY